MHTEAGEQLGRARRALLSNDGAAMREQANGAWANNARVYAAVEVMTPVDPSRFAVPTLAPLVAVAPRVTVPRL